MKGVRLNGRKQTKKDGQRQRRVLCGRMCFCPFGSCGQRAKWLCLHEHLAGLCAGSTHFSTKRSAVQVMRRKRYSSAIQATAPLFEGWMLLCIISLWLLCSLCSASVGAKRVPPGLNTPHITENENTSLSTQAHTGKCFYFLHG